MIAKWKGNSGLKGLIKSLNKENARLLLYLVHFREILDHVWY